jgi:Astacin (Peptidase family M12A)
VHPPVWHAILYYGLVMGSVTFAADRVSEAQQEYYSDSGNDKQKESDEEKRICDSESKYSYTIDDKPHYVPYEVIDGQDVIEGDIVIGQSNSARYAPTVLPFLDHQVTRWGHGVAPYVVPYVIDGSVDNEYKYAIEKAMRLWTSKTKIRFDILVEPPDFRHQNYVKFVYDPSKTLCYSNSFGIKSKVSQFTDKDKEDDNINVVQLHGCDFGNEPVWGRIAHEIGHVLGLGHEQSREDRGENIRILWDNFKDNGSKKQFCRPIYLETQPYTPYDFDSIMHYSDRQGAKASGCPGQKECMTFVVVNPQKLQHQEEVLGRKIVIGQRNHLSEEDIAAVNAIYPDTRPPPRDPNPARPPERISQSCVITTTTTTSVGNQTTTTTTTEACQDHGPVPRPHWPRPHLPRPGCWPGWCRPYPRPPICDGWIEDGWGPPPFDD